MSDEVKNNERFSEVKMGPKHPYQRSCTDILCCILFCINVGVMVGFALYGYTNGDTTNVYRATDEKGNICGASNSSTTNFPYAYFYNPTSGNLNHRTCVEACPGLNGNSPSSINCFSAGNNLGKCSYDVVVNSSGNFNATPTTTDLIGYDTYSVIGRVCIPTATVFQNAFASYTQTFNNGLRQAGIANFIEDIQNNWKWLLLSLVLAVLLSVLFMAFLKCFAGCFIWVSLLLMILLLAGATVLFLYNGGAIGQPSFAGNFGISIPNLPSFGYYNVFGWICLGLFCIVCLIVVCCCRRISLAVALCGIAGEFVASTCQVMLVPVVMGAAVFALWVFCLYAMVTLIGTAQFVVNGTDVFTSIQSYTSASLGYFYYFVFATLWSNALLQAIAVFVIASACAVWYFSKSPNMQELDSPVCSGFWMTFRYHFGSLAFGSFILALVQFIQFIFEVLNRQVEASGAASNVCFEYLMNCIRCCLECIKRIVEFINKNAFILISITGRNFCGSAADAVSLITANPLRFSVVSIVGWLLALVGKLLIAGLTTFLFYIFVTFVTNVSQNIQEPILMLVLVGLAAFAIATIFMGVFDVSVDTLLMCFLIDEAVNLKPQYAHPQLAGLLDS